MSFREILCARSENVRGNGAAHPWKHRTACIPDWPWHGGAWEARVHQKEEAEKLNVSVDALVIGATLCEPFADIVLSGAVNTNQLLSNVAGSLITFDASARARLSEIAESSDEYWSARRRLSWN